MRERAQLLIERVIGKWNPSTNVIRRSRRIGRLVGLLMSGIGLVGFLGRGFSPGTPAPLCRVSTNLTHLAIYGILPTRIEVPHEALLRNGNSAIPTFFAGDTRGDI